MFHLILAVRNVDDVFGYCKSEEKLKCFFAGVKNPNLQIWW